MSLHSDIMIAGGGIAGLCAALSLAQAGYPVTVVEAFSRPSEVGAGIQVPPNACHVLSQIGVLKDLKSRAIQPQAVRLGDATTGAIMLSMPVNGDGTPYAPFLTVHRAALHDVLYRAAADHPDIEIITGHRIERIQADGAAVLITAETNDGTAQLSTKTLIGADGIWSRCRRAVKGASEPQLTGRIALRAVVPMAANKQLGDTITAWMAPHSHLVCYPVRNSDTLNLVAITEGTATPQIWDSAAAEETLSKLADQFSACGFRNAFAKTKWTVWPLADVQPDGVWHNDRTVVLIGDAAHATEPFAAQGAAMAVEDGYALAKSIAASNGDMPQAFANYRKMRATRVIAMAKRTAFNRKVYHMSGVSRIARNVGMKFRKPEAFLKDLDWLYSYRI